jgi:hypothetical protein
MRARLRKRGDRTLLGNIHFKTQVIMTNSKRLAVFAAMIVIFCCSTMFVSTGAWADCSSAPALPPGCSGWTSATLTTSASGCPIKVYYCTACCNGVAYSYVYKIDVIGGAECNAVNPELMIYAAAKAARDAAANGCAPPPCPMTGRRISTYIPTCWTESGIAGEYEILVCSDPSCYCEEDCDVCLDHGVLVYSNCTSSTSGTCICNTIPGDGIWLIGTCYTITCHTI